MAIANEWNPSTNILFTFDASNGATTLDLSGAGQTASFTIKTGATQGAGTAIFTLAADGSIALGNGRTLTAASAGNATTISAGGATVAGSNLAGGNLTLQSGISTGTGRSFTIISAPTPASASGTSDNTQVTRLIAGSIAVVNAGTNIATIPLAANQAANIIVLWGYTATDGTDTHAFCGQSVIAAVNKAAALTNTVTELSTWQAKAVSAGTVTEAVTVTLASSVLTVKFTPTDSLTPTTQRLDYVMLCLSGQTVTPL